MNRRGFLSVAASTLLIPVAPLAWPISALFIVPPGKEVGFSYGSCVGGALYPKTLGVVLSPPVHWRLGE